MCTYVLRTLNYWSPRFKNESNVFFLIRIVEGGVQAGSTRRVGHWMAYCTCPLPRVIMMMENLVEWRLEGETEVLG
jgi:hypothetical protein